MSKSSDIKAEIVTLLNELKTAGTIGTVIEDDFKVSNPFSRDIALYPAAVVNPPAISSEFFDNARNVRSYTFSIGIILKGENISSATDIEVLSETIMDKLDQNPTLSGTADAGVEPSISDPEPVNNGDKTYVVLVIKIKAKAFLAFK